MANPLLGHCTGAYPDTGLVRSRLIPDFNGPLNPRLGLAVGPPGSGKTTLLTQWAARVDGPVAWCRAGGREPQPGHMLSDFAEALAAATGTAPASSYSGLAKAVDRLEQQFHYIVDDFHALEAGGAEAELERLLTLASPRLCFFVGSRHLPGINLAKSELQTAYVVNGQDLRFRVTEIDQLFRSTYKQPLGPDGVENLARQSEGWAAGLYLFHLATRCEPPLERRRAAQQLGSCPRYTRDYLTRHFLAGISGDMDQLLRATCLLDVLTRSRCEALLERLDCGRLLQRLERLGIISTEDDGATYRTPLFLKHYLVSGLSDEDPLLPNQLRQRSALVLEQEGAVGEALKILAEGRDWDGIGRLLGRAGRSAIRPGRCAWAALLPADVLRGDAWATLARARQLVDDGCGASARLAADRVAALTADRDCAALARDLRLAAAPWAPTGAALPLNGQPGRLRDALHRNPGAVAVSLAKTPGPRGELNTGLAFLLAGDQRSALPLLRRIAQRVDVDPLPALAAHLALAVFGPDCLDAAAEGAAAEVEAVQRQAERRGYTWLARLARGVQAGLPGTPACDAAVNAVVETCEARGDPWGAALVAACSALLRLRAGNPAATSFDAAAVRFRRLSAGTLEAWAHAAQALAAAALDLPGAAEEMRSAEAFARAAGVPGALAVAYAATALQNPDDYEDLMLLANRTGHSAGLVCRPWTWLVPDGGRPDRNGSAIRPADNGVQLVREEYAVRPAPAPRGCTPPPSLGITCFGGFALRRNPAGLDLSRIRPQAMTVLRILSLNAGRLVHREQLVGVLWADLDRAAALHALQVSVSCLRGALQPEGTADGSQLLVRQGEAYALTLGPASAFDLADFDHSLHTAALARTAGDDTAAAESLRQAVNLYTGEVLPEDGSADWVTETRERYRLRAAEAASSLAGMELGLGNSAAAAAAATRSVEIDPWRDESWRTLVETFHRLGDPVAAQRAQKRYDLMLRSLGVAGGHDTAASPTA